MDSPGLPAAGGHTDTLAAIDASLHRRHHRRDWLGDESCIAGTAAASRRNAGGAGPGAPSVGGSVLAALAAACVDAGSIDAHGHRRGPTCAGTLAHSRDRTGLNLGPQRRHSLWRVMQEGEESGRADEKCILGIAVVESAVHAAGGHVLPGSD